MIRALLKKPNLDPEVWSNIRLVSLLPGISKILEKHVNKILSEHLENHSLLHTTQTGFCPNHGTETALLAVVEESRKILNRGGAVAVILRDLSSAFDTVNYNILFDRFRMVGVSGKALAWIKSFLKDRVFQVFEGNYTSKCLTLSCGVPQGSSLSPTPFNIYLKPLAELVLPYGIQIITYADDMQLVVALKHPKNTPINFESCMETVATWMD